MTRRKKKTTENAKVRIIPLGGIKADTLRVSVDEADGEPILKTIAVY